MPYQPPPPPPPVPTGVLSGGQTYNPELAARVLEGVRAKRSELKNQLDRLEDKRGDLRNELNSDEMRPELRPGIEARIKEIDVRISDLDAQIAKADLSVAEAAAVPGATTPPPSQPRNGPPDDVFIAVPIVFTLFVLFPIAFAYSRRLWKKASTVVGPVPQEVRDRLDQLGDAVDSIAIEVERIGEGQRFVTKVMTDNSRALGVGAAQPIPVPQAQAERVGARPGI